VGTLRCTLVASKTESTLRQVCRTEVIANEKTALPEWVMRSFRHASGRHEAASMPSGDSNPHPAIASGERSGVAQVRPAALLAGVLSRFAGRGRLNEPRYKLFWQTTAIAASMLIFASIRPSTIAITARDTTPPTLLNFVSKGLGSRVSGARSQQMGVSKTAETHLHQSTDFVAKDFTNHFNLHAQSIVTVQKSELSGTGQRQ
jgi:hypothetical protein